MASAFSGSHAPVKHAFYTRLFDALRCQCLLNSAADFIISRGNVGQRDQRSGLYECMDAGAIAEAKPLPNSTLLAGTIR